MNQDSPETPVTWVEEHPWLAQISAAEDDDSIDEVMYSAVPRFHFV